MAKIVTMHVEDELKSQLRPLNEIEFTERELNELAHCVNYAENYHHGADGHNRMMLVAKLAKGLGMILHQNGVIVPERAVVEMYGENRAKIFVADSVRLD